MSPSVIMNNLKKLYLDDSLVSYTVSGPSSPYGQGLDYVYVGKNLENIGDSNISAFNAKEIECSDDLKVIPSKAFEYLNDCKLHLPNNLITIGSEAFKASNLTSIDLPNKLQTIASNAFQGSKLVQLELPASMNTLSDSAFDSCNDLVSVKMDNVLATENLDLKALRLGEGTFSNCTKLEKVELPNQIRNLGANTFKDDTSLSKLYLGTELDTVDETAFDGCSSLSSVYCYRYTKYNKPYMTELKEDVDNNTFEDCPSDIHFIEV